MHYRSSMQRAAARLSSFIRRPRAWLVMFALLALLPDVARAACSSFNVPDSNTTPSTSPMASNGTITIAIGDQCDGFGLNPYFPDTGDGTTNPLHGTASVDTLAGTITYINNGDGATSDSFVVEDSSGDPFTINVAIGAATSPITVSPGSLLQPQVGAPYSQTLSASGGSGPYSYVLSSGPLPHGLSFSGTTISGTPDQAGTYPVTFTVTDSASVTATKSYSITVPNPTNGIAVAAPPAANLGTFYNEPLSASGALAPYSFAVYSGSTLPPGLSLASDGTLSGTPGSLGSYNFNVVVTEASPNLAGTSPGPYSKVVNVTLQVLNVPPTANPVSATVAYGSSNNPITLNISGAPATSVAIDISPAHGTASAAGTSITYTPAAGYAGTDNFTYKASNGAGTSSAAAVNVTVSPPTITYAPGNPPAGTAGVAYNQSLATGISGGAAPYHNFSLASGTLPAGLDLASDGTLSGTPTAAGTFTFKLTAQDSSTGDGPFSVTTASDLTLTIAGPAIVIAPTLPAGTIHSAYSGAFSASGGTAPYTFEVTAGSLPAGLTLATDGTLSGTPTTVGSFNFTVTATDATTGTGSPFTKSEPYTLVINGVPLTLTPSTVPDATYGSAYTPVVLSASGGTGPYSFEVTAGALPPGLALATDGTLSGTPTQAGTFPYTVTATDAEGSTGSQPYTLTVAAVVPDAPSIDSVTAGDAQAQVTVSAPASDGGASIASYTATASPGGATATLAGPSGGTITVPGLTNGTAYTFTVTATNAAGTGPASAPSGSVVPKGTQVITFNNPGTQNFGTTPTLTATSSSGLVPTFSSSTSGVCTITSGGALTFASAGTCTFDADQNGNGAYLPAPTVTQSFTVASVTPGTPTIGSATAGDASATVSFTAPASDGGATITGYTVTSSPGGLTGTGAASPITVTGLTNGTAYTFTVTAMNGAGTGGTSGASNSVTPMGAQTITFANPGATNFGDSPQLLATASSGLGVTFTSTTTSVCTITSGGKLTTLAPGTCTISADQAGDGTYLPAPTVTESFAIVVPGGAVSISTASLPQATAESAYSQTIVANGGASPYGFAVSAGSLPAGLTLSGAGVLSGTPTVAGTFNFTVKVTDAATQTATQALTLVVQGPAITLGPSSLPGGIAGTAYSQTLTASGGQAPYTYAVSAGALQAGLSLTTAGVLSGTPTAAGSFNPTVTVTDGLGFTASQAYTLGIGEPAPVTHDDTVNVAANGTATLAVTGNDSGPITSIAVTGQPAHGTATVDGLNVVYKPAANYFGSDTLEYTATGPGGTSAAATVSITVVAGAKPVATAKAATVLAGKSVTLHAAAGAANGPFTGVSVVKAPDSGSAKVQGTDIVYTAAADASGKIGFDYTLSNAFGASQPAHVTITVNPRPVAPALKATAIAGTTVKVDLTDGARGGPFTGAKVVSVSPAEAGSATVTASGDSYMLSFTAASTFGGVAQITYTLSNAFATSEPGTVDVTVKLRSDPSRDAEVIGVLNAQAEAARRMAIGQIGNFQRRLESLHNGGSRAGFSNGITMNSASRLRRPDAPVGMQQGMGGGGDPFLAPNDAAANGPAGSSEGSTPGGFAFWTGGAANFGKLQPGTSDDGIDFTTSGLSLGADKQVTRSLALGLGIGYGHDASDIGRQGSRSTVDSYNVAAYGSYQPGESTYIDALAGYQWLQFDARRFVTDNGNTVRGSRDGKQWFVSFSAGYRHQADDMLLTPYGRLDLARATLDGYTETGDDVFALNYLDQTVKTSTATVGVLAQWTVKRDYGIWAPQLRAEFGHDMQGSSQAMMRYADLLSGPLYQATLNRQSRNHTLLGAGITLQTAKGWSLRAEYQNQLDNTSRDNQGIQLGVQKVFP
jgi:uncharacterized protein YhjY with autotransporter beta-barrel domain